MLRSSHAVAQAVGVVAFNLTAECGNLPRYCVVQPLHEIIAQTTGIAAFNAGSVSGGNEPLNFNQEDEL